MASLAHDAASESAVSRWLEAHSPAPATWKLLVGARGFRPNSDPEVLHRVHRTLPEHSTKAGNLWRSGNGLWLARSAAEGLEVYTRATGPKLHPPQDWKPLGSGWPAFEALLAEPDLRALPRPRPLARDPRAILF